MTEKINPYSQHFRCMARLLRNSSQNDIFMYLLDEHLMMTRKRIAQPCIQYNQKRIAEESGVYRGCVDANISKLENLGLIHIQDKLIFMDVNYLMSIVSLFNIQETYADKQSVCKAFRSNDKKTLRTLGWQEIFDGNDQLQQLEGTIVLETTHNCLETDTSVGKQTQVSETKQICRETDTSVGNQALMLETKHLFEPFFKQFPEKSGFLCWALSKFTDKNIQKRATELADTVYQTENMADTDKIAGNCRKLLDFWVFLGVLETRQLCLETDTGVLETKHNSSEKCLKPSNRNKENKEKINYWQNESFEQEGNMNEVEEHSEDFKEPEENSQLDSIELNIPELEGKRIRKERPRREPSEQVTTIYPFFSVDEIDEIVNNIDEAKKSPQKLFLYNLWGILSDLTNETVEHSYEDEDDEESNEELSEDSFEDPTGKFISRQDYFRAIRNAYDETAGMIETGVIDMGDEEIELNISQMFSSDLLTKIIEWESGALTCKEVSVLISKEGIHNIEAQPSLSLPRPRQPETREERRQAAYAGRDLMRRLYKAKQSETLYSQLTKIERVAADAIMEYFIPNPDKEDKVPFVFKDGPCLTRDKWRQLQVQIHKAGLKEDDFFCALLGDNRPNDGGQLYIREPMFLLEGIHYVNSLYQETSILETIEV